MSDDAVPNQPPAVDPGAVRLAVVGEAPAVEECSWATCQSGHGFATRHWSNKQLVERHRCAWCGTDKWELTPRPFVGESGRLLDTLLKESGLPRERVFVGNCSRHPLNENEKTLEHCIGGLAMLAFELEQFRPHCVLLLGNLALSAFAGYGRSVTNWRGSVTRGHLHGEPYKICVACHPAAILREPSQLALLRLDVKRAVEEAATATLTLPVREFWYPQSGAALCKRSVRVEAEPEDIPF